MFCVSVMVVTQNISIELPNECFVSAANDPGQHVAPRQPEPTVSADDPALRRAARRPYYPEHGEGAPTVPSGCEHQLQHGEA